jgi:pyrroloquinoline-quinone synthase
MDRITELREIVNRYDLNKHPFYTEWRMGTLPMAKLDRYAEDYGRFVALIADGWERVGRADYAEEERVHHDLWTEFAASVRSARKEKGEGATFEGKPALPETGSLIDTTRVAFSAAPAALGALYAFELQQPVTSVTKLEGLREHYPVGKAGEKYFEEHADKWHEVEALEELINKLDEPAYQKAKAACDLVSSSMWQALDGINA